MLLRPPPRALLPPPKALRPLPQAWQTPRPVGGLCLRIVLHSTHGDAHYVGLQEVMLLTAAGERLRVPPAAFHARPHSLRDLGQEDPRVPGRLAGLAEDALGGCGWLAPLAGGLEGFGGDNEVCVQMDEAFELGALVLRNYERTPARGAKDLSVFLDGRIVYSGALPPAGEPHAVIFGGGPALPKRRAYAPAEQDVLMIDERRVAVRPANAAPAHARAGARPTTSLGR